MKHYNIPVFVPHSGCPHDCVFCNQKRITGHTEPVNAAEARKIIDDYLKNVRHDGFVEIAFFGGSFTGIPIENQNELLSLASGYVKSGSVNGIRLSTRPDYINKEILENLKRFGVTTIELGVQSLNDEVLCRSMRGHGSECVAESARLIKEYGFSLGLQMMTGLPGDTPEKSYDTAVKIADMAPDFVRIYPTLVIKDTALADMLKSGEYTPFTLEETVKLLADIKQLFDLKNITVIRMGLQTTEEISPNASVVAGPYHAAIGEMAESEIYKIKLEKLLVGISNKTVTVGCAKSDVSKVVGHKRRNAIYFLEKYGIRLFAAGDEHTKSGELRIIEVK